MPFFENTFLLIGIMNSSHLIHLIKEKIKKTNVSKNHLMLFYHYLAESVSKCNQKNDEVPEELQPDQSLKFVIKNIYSDKPDQSLKSVIKNMYFDGNLDELTRKLFVFIKSMSFIILVSDLFTFVHLSKPLFRSDFLSANLLTCSIYP